MTDKPPRKRNMTPLDWQASSRPPFDDPETIPQHGDSDRIATVADASAMLPDDFLTDRPPPSSKPTDPHDMSTRELMIEAVVFARAHAGQHEVDAARLAEGDRLFKTLDAEIEMLAHSFQTVLRKLDADDAADKLAAYWEDKRRERNERSDAAARNVNA